MRKEVGKEGEMASTEFGYATSPTADNAADSAVVFVLGCQRRSRRGRPMPRCGPMTPSSPEPTELQARLTRRRRSRVCERSEEEEKESGFAESRTSWTGRRCSSTTRPPNQPGQPAQPPHVVPVSASTTFSLQTQQPLNSMDQGDLAPTPDTTTQSTRPPVTRGIASTNMTRSRAMTEEQEAGEGGRVSSGNAPPSPQDSYVWHPKPPSTIIIPPVAPAPAAPAPPPPPYPPQPAPSIIITGGGGGSPPCCHHPPQMPLPPPPPTFIPIPFPMPQPVMPQMPPYPPPPQPPAPIILAKYVPPEELSEAPSEPVAEKSTVLEEWQPPTPEKKEPEIPGGPMGEEQPDMFPFFEEPQYGLLAWLCLFLVALIPCLLLFFIVVPAGVYLGLFLYSSTISYCYSDSCKSDAATYLTAYQNGDPCEDFYELICSDWEYNHKIPPYRYIFSAGIQRQDRIEASLKRRLEGGSLTPALEPLAK
ncbi:hypothetical protein MRX96_046089 [Rhipicephalus microplus]